MTEKENTAQDNQLQEVKENTAQDNQLQEVNENLLAIQQEEEKCLIADNKIMNYYEEVIENLKCDRVEASEKFDLVKPTLTKAAGLIFRKARFIPLELKLKQIKLKYTPLSASFPKRINSIGRILTIKG